MTSQGIQPEASYWQKIRMLGRDVRLFLISGAIFGVGRTGILTVLLNLYLVRLGLGPQAIGIINSVTWLSYAILSFPAGALGARFGVRRCMVAGLVASLIGMLALPLVEALAVPWRIPWLVAARLVAGLGSALYAVNASPFMMGATLPEERDHAFSMWMALTPLAGFAGSLAAGALPGLFASGDLALLSDPMPYRYALLLGALLVTPSIPILLATGEVDGGGRPGIGLRQSDVALPLLGVIILVGMFRLAGEGGIRSFYNVYLDVDLGASPAQIGTVMAVAQLVGGFAALAMPLLAQRWGLHATVVIGALGASLSLLPLALVPRLGAAAVAFVTLMMAASIARAAYMVYCQNLVKPECRPIMAGATNMSSGMGMGLTALGGGYAAAALGYRGFFLLPMALIASGALVFWAYFRVPRGELSATPAAEASE